MAAYGVPYKALFIVLLTPCWIPVGTLMTVRGIFKCHFQTSFTLLSIKNLLLAANWYSQIYI